MTFQDPVPAYASQHLPIVTPFPIKSNFWNALLIPHLVPPTGCAQDMLSPHSVSQNPGRAARTAAGMSRWGLQALGCPQPDGSWLWERVLAGATLPCVSASTDTKQAYHLRMLQWESDEPRWDRAEDSTRHLVHDLWATVTGGKGTLLTLTAPPTCSHATQVPFINPFGQALVWGPDMAAFFLHLECPFSSVDLEHQHQSPLRDSLCLLWLSVSGSHLYFCSDWAIHKVRNDLFSTVCAST